MAYALFRLIPQLSIILAILSFSAPLVGGYLLQSLNGSINAFWIGRHLGAQELVIATIANSFLFVLTAILFGISQATSILVARATGASHRGQIHKSIRVCTRLFALLLFAIVLLGNLFVHPIIALFSTGNIEPHHASAYVRWMLISLVPLMGLIMAYAILRGQKNSYTPFVFMAITVVLDAALNPLFIFGFGPMPALGLQGCAVATLLANLAGFCGMLFWLAKKQPLIFHAICLAWHTRLKRSDVCTIISLALPMGAQMLIVATSLTLMLKLINTQGITLATAYSAALQLWNYLQMPVIAIGAACSIAAAQHIGANQWEKMRHILLAGVWCSAIITSLMLALTLAFDQALLALFLLKNDSNALSLAQQINEIVLISFLLQGLDLVYTGIVKGNGATAAALIIACVHLLLIRLPLAWFLLHAYGQESMWFAVPISALIGLILSWLYYQSGHWRRMKGPNL